MRPIRIAAITMNGLLGQTADNLASIGRWTQRAKQAGADLALFPELVVNGHCDPDTVRNAEPVPEGNAAQEIVRIAQQNKMFVCAGLSERAGSGIYNTQVLAGPDGFVGAQRKIHLSRDETLFFQGGNETAIFQVLDWRVGISICYDNWMPEVPRMLALQGADLILMPHASRMKMWRDTPDSEREAAMCIHSFFRRIYPARAFENACFAVAVNQAGRAGTVDIYPPDHPNQPHHAGGSIVFDPFGEVVAETAPDRIEETMLVAELDPTMLQDARSHPNYSLRTRRPELFGRLAEMK